MRTPIRTARAFALLLVLTACVPATSDVAIQVTETVVVTESPDPVAESTTAIENRNSVSESELGVFLSDEDYQEFQSLRDEREFFTSPIYHEIQILSWQFAWATINSDEDTMRSLAVPNMEIGVTGSDFNLDNLGDLEFLILKYVRRENDAILANYEFLIKGDDSYNYLTIEMTRFDDEWKVSFYGFEK